MDIYRTYAENELDRYIFYHSYRPSHKEIILELKKIIKYEPYIYDIFPEPNQADIILNEPLSIITKSGKEMFIQHGIKMSCFDTFRILFGELIEKT